METALILTIVAAVAVGTVAAVVRTWSLHARLYSLEDRLSVVEGVTTREVKIRAAQSRGPQGKRDEEMLKALTEQPQQNIRRNNWWETGLPRSAAR